jgi:hypothetical protein
MLRLIDEKNKVIEVIKLQFTKRNVEKIASNYDASIQKLEPDTKSATLKDSKGRLIFIDEVSKRFMKKLTEQGMFHKYGFPDDGSGITTDDDRPPGNILIGTRYKPTGYFNKLTPFNRNWDIDTGKWKWDDFENAEGQEDFTNYSQTLQGLKTLLPKDTWEYMWKHMKDTPDKEATADFKKAGMPHRTAATQLGKEKEDTAEPPKELKLESLLSRIDILTM